MTLKTIRLALARSKEFPAGADNRGYVFKAPLTADGSLDRDAWGKYKKIVLSRAFGLASQTKQDTWCIHGVVFGLSIVIR